MTPERPDKSSIVITRPAPDATRLARAISLAGFRPLISPLLDIVFSAAGHLDREVYQAITATSANGFRALERGWTVSRAMRAFCIGPASAAAARAAGFAGIVMPDQANARALTALICQRLSPADGPLLYLSGRHISVDLHGILQKQGFSVDRRVVYEAVARSHLTDETADALRAGAVSGVVIYSPRSARLWVKQATAIPVLSTARLVYFCLSEHVRQALEQGFGHTVTAFCPQAPDDEAMAALIARHHWQ